MSWLSEQWHNITGTPDDNTRNMQAAQLQQQQQAAKDAAQASLKAQQDANLIAAAAAMPAADNEGTRAAMDDVQRRLMQSSGFGIGLPDKLGAPPVGFRMLSGQ